MAAPTLLVSNDSLILVLSSVLFWSDWGTHAKIERSGMDGQGRSPFITADIVWPNGLTLDYPLQRLYWVDASLDRLERIDTDGTNRLVSIHSCSLNFLMFGI